MALPHRVFNRHSRAGGNLEFTLFFWIPACAGMTKTTLASQFNCMQFVRPEYLPGTHRG